MTSLPFGLLSCIMKSLMYLISYSSFTANFNKDVHYFYLSWIIRDNLVQPKNRIVYLWRTLIKFTLRSFCAHLDSQNKCYFFREWKQKNAAKSFPKQGWIIGNKRLPRIQRLDSFIYMFERVLIYFATMNTSETVLKAYQSLYVFWYSLV